MSLSSKLPDRIIKKGIQLAQKAAVLDEVPVGAVLFNSKTFEIISTGYNKTERLFNTTAHAEIECIRKAEKKLKTTHLVGHSLFVTLEPCPMCAGAIGWSKLDAVYFGATDPKSGGVLVGPKIFTHTQCHHKPAVFFGFMAEQCGQLLSDFFKGKRKK